MTKYVLQSGGIKNNPPKAVEYFSTLFNEAGRQPKILWCYFAGPQESAEECYKETYENIFTPFFPENVHPENRLATLENFPEEAHWADVIYYHGGDDQIFHQHVKNFDLKNIHAGKLVFATSASTLIFATHGWSCDSRTLVDGLGLWPAKVIAHFNSEYGSDDPRGSINWQQAKSDLEAYGDTSLPVYALEEGEFVVFEV